jgi:archaellum component FlaC
VDDDLKRMIEKLAAENRRDNAETRRQFEAFATDIRRDFNILRTNFDDQQTSFRGLRTNFGDLRNHFGMVVEHFDRRFDLLAEGLENVQQIDTRQVNTLRDETKQDSDEIRGMLKFSHSGLDRRLTTVEKDVKKLKTKR